MQRPKKETMKYLGYFRIHPDPARLKPWTSLPGLPPVYVMVCRCGGEYRRLIHRDNVATTTFRCGKCSRHVELFTEK